MIEWVSVNTCKITRIGYNQEVKTMYIDFTGSSFDTPYKNVSMETFKDFTQSDRVDNYYDVFIKDMIEPTLLNTESTIVYDQKIVP